MTSETQFAQRLDALRKAVEKRALDYKQAVDPSFSKEQLVEEYAIFRAELEAQLEELLAVENVNEELLEKFQRLFDAAPAGIVLLRIGTAEIVQMNQAAFDILNVDSKRRKLFLSSYFSTAGSVADPLSQITFSDWLFDDKQESIELALANRENVWVNLKKSPFDDNSLLVSVVDITDIKRAQIQAEQLNDSKTRFIANITHELRTPLSSIVGLNELILGSEQPLAGDNHKMLEKAQRQASHMLSLINELLDISEIRSGHFTLNRQSFSVPSLLQEIQDFLNDALSGSSVEARVEADLSGCENLLGDTKRIKQVLLNLLGNAIKFTDQGHVGLTVFCRPKTVNSRLLEFSVTNSGLPIPVEDFARILMPFEQLDNQSNRRFAGSGLGLAICQELLGAMDSRLELSSNEEQTEFRFRLILPLSHAPEPSKSAAEEADLSVLQGLRVLVVDDMEDNRLVASLMLERSGCQVEQADNALDALKMIDDRGEAIQLVLLDQQMPGMDGLEAAGLMRSKGYSGLIYALSANSDAHSVELSFKAGMDQHINKPLDLRIVARMLVKDHLSKRALYRA